MSSAPQSVMTNVLFVTWDGPKSTYLTGLFLPIFRALSDRGYRFHVLQFGWGDERERATLHAACAEAGVAYRAAPIWRRPIALGGLASALVGIWAARRAMRDWSIDLVLPRSYAPALATIPAARIRRVPILLDADGLPNDERVEFAGCSSRGVTNMLLSALERYALRNANWIMVRTARAAEILSLRSGVPAERFTVVANARDSLVFRPPDTDQRLQTRRGLGISETAPLILFVGTALTGKYRGDLIREYFRLVHQRRPDSRLLFVMPDSSEARALMEPVPELAAASLYASRSPAEVPALIGAADLGLSLIRATPSMQAASAVKTGEYLLCGVPVLATTGVGGIERLIVEDAGLCIEGNDPAALAIAAEWFCRDLLQARERFATGARRVGLSHFSLDRAIDAYECALRATVKRRVASL